MTQSGVRSLAFSISLLFYALLDTLLTADFVRSHVSSTHPEMLKATLIAARSIQLAAIILVVERLSMYVWARRILGVWAYHSDSGNFGLAEIKLVRGELTYEVELYRSA